MVKLKIILTTINTVDLAYSTEVGILAHFCSPSTQEAKAKVLPGFPGQLQTRLQCETVFRKKGRMINFIIINYVCSYVCTCVWQPDLNL